MRLQGAQEGAGAMRHAWQGVVGSLGGAAGTQLLMHTGDAVAAAHGGSAQLL